MSLQKDLASIMNQKKQLFCTDIEHTSVINLTSYPIISGNASSSSNFSLVTLDEYTIADANETEIITNGNITLKSPDVTTGTPPNQTTEPGDIIICDEKLKIPLNSLNEIGLNYNSLIGRKVRIISSDSIRVTFSSGNIIINKDVSTRYILVKDSELEILLNNYVNSLSSENTKQLLKFDFPNINSFFSKYDDFTDVLIGYKGCYKEPTYINNIVGESNEFLRVDIDSFLNKDDFQEHFNLYNTHVNNFFREHDSWVAYFARLKKLMSKMRISDAMVDEEECENLFYSKSSDSQNDIIDMYNVYLENNRELYTENKQVLLFNIKID